MSKLALSGLSKQIEQILKDQKDVYRGYVNKIDQEYTLTVQEFYKELSGQYKYIRKYSSLSSSEFDDKLMDICQEYVSKVSTQFKNLSNKTKFARTEKVTYSYTEIPGGFTAVASDIDTESRGSADKFKAISSKKRQLLTDVKTRVLNELFQDYRSSSSYQKYDEAVRLRGEVNTSSKFEQMDRAIFGNVTWNDKKDKSLGTKSAKTAAGYIVAERTGGTTQAGHRNENAISKLLRRDILSSLSSAINTGQNVLKIGTKEYTLVEFDIEARTLVTNALKGRGPIKKFTANVKHFDEGSRKNQGDASREQAILRRLPNAILNQIIRSNGIRGIVEQEASLSGIDLVMLSLAEASNSSKKVKPKIKTDFSRSNKSNSKTTAGKKSIKGKATKTKLTDGDLGNPIKDPASGSRTQKSTPRNWLSLLTIINQKLPQQVAKNMGAPGLVYRTGRFANSTKVVNIETTRDGNPSIVFDYQRDPYDVFDRRLGRSPWNTPARDPRALVDKSVREIVQELAIGRFYTRRAQ